MSAAPLQENEASRLQSLRDLEVLDTAPEEEFDSLVKVAALICGVPVSLITLVDTDRQWFKANLGLEGTSQTSRDVAFCAHAILGDDLFEIYDARQDVRFADNPLVRSDPNIRFYAGMPLHLSDGANVGTLCVIDRQPRHLDADQREGLRHLAKAATQALEGRRALLVERRLLLRLAENEDRIRKLYEATPAMLHSIDAEGRLLSVSDHWLAKLGYQRDEVIGLPASSFLTPESRERSINIFAAMIDAEGSCSEIEYQFVKKSGEILDGLLSAVLERDVEGKPLRTISIIEDVTQRKQAEQALQLSKRFLDKTGSLADIGGWELDLITNQLLWSDETYRIHGLERGNQPTVQEAINFYAPEARPVISAAVEKGMTSSGTGWDLELPFTKADGRKIWVRAVGSTEFEDGKPVRLVGAFQDITEHMSGRLALEEMNTRISLATDSAGIGIWDLDTANGTLIWDAWMYRLYGVPEGGGTGTYEMWRRLIHPDDLAAIEDLAVDAIAGKHPFEMEFRIIREDGSIRHMRATARVLPDETGRPPRIIGVNWDITERINRQEALRLSEERFRTLYKKTPVMMHSTGSDGRLLTVSEQWLKSLGYKRDEVIGRNTLEFMTQASQDFARRVVLPRFYMNGVVDSEPHQFIRKDGTIIDTVISAIMEKNTEGKTIQSLAVIIDVTAHLQAERALEISREDAESANRAKSAFLATMSHEIRTPLNGIVGFAEVLLDTPLSTDQRQKMRYLKQACSSLLAIVNDVLDISKIEAGKLELESVPLNLLDLAEGSLGIVSAQAEAKGLAIEFNIDPQLPLWLKGDPIRLRQVLLNFISNAIKFTKSGSVTLDIAGDPERSGHIKFMVSDTGIGIPFDRQHLLFRNFSQIDQPHNRQPGGSGLGLAISKLIVEAMPDGQVGVASAPGQGSQFWFSMQMEAVEAPAALEPEPAPSPPNAAPARILVADDIALNQILLEMLLGNEGHFIAVAGNGQEALEAVQREDFDLILMDMEMPVMDGLAATRAIRALDGPVRDTPIVALTANALSGEAASCLDAGMNDYLSKPIDRDKLVSTISRWARGRSGSSYMNQSASPTLLDPVK